MKRNRARVVLYKDAVLCIARHVDFHTLNSMRCVSKEWRRWIDVSPQTRAVHADIGAGTLARPKVFAPGATHAVFHNLSKQEQDYVLMVAFLYPQKLTKPIYETDIEPAFEYHLKQHTAPSDILGPQLKFCLDRSIEGVDIHFSIVCINVGLATAYFGDPYQDYWNSTLQETMERYNDIIMGKHRVGLYTKRVWNAVARYM